MNVDVTKARSIFAEAVENHPPDQWDRFLDAACGEDLPLRRRVELLLKAHQGEDSFLDRGDQGRGSAPFDQPLTEKTGTPIGPYKLREQIGEGGMGVVYVAEQMEPVKRKVALKIIKPGMASKDVVVRFEVERQALAMMDHPNIARVFDGGATEAGQPYFVMELVQGLPITEYCDQHQLSAEDRLKLFATVCRAVQHAHQKGIIHRDLKPSNIIVSEIDDKAVPKVIDFGVAKAVGQTLTDATLYTHFSQMVGTPLYMSPEQTTLGVVDIDTRSDVYSLGVLLYELLTGNTPFNSETLKQAGFDEMRRIIREDEPLRPSAMVSTLSAEALSTISQRRRSDPRKLSDSLKRELDWVVMKALEKDRNQRYQTARGLAADVNRFLAGEPVEARPPTLGYRLSKFVNRYRVPVAVASLVLFLLVASSVLAWVLLVDAQRARNDAVLATAEAVAAKDETQRQKERAEANLARAQQQEKMVASLAEERQRRLYDYNVITIGAALRQGEQLKTAHLLAECSEEQRRWEWYRLRRLVEGGRTLQLSETPITAYCVSPTKPQIVTVDAAGNYRLCNLDTGEVIMSQPGIGQPGICSLGPDGKLLVLLHTWWTNPAVPGRLEVWEAAAGRKVWEFASESEVFGCGSFSADGKLFAFGGFQQGSGEGTVYLVDLISRKLIWKHPTPHPGGPLPVFAPDGRHIYVTIQAGVLETVKKASLLCWSIEGPPEIWWAQEPFKGAMPCVTPDGSQVITCGENHSLKIRDARTGELLQELPGDLPDVGFWSAFSPDGRHLVSVGQSWHVLVRDWHSKQKLDSFTLPVSNGIFVPQFLPGSEQFVVPSAKVGAVVVRDVRPSPAEITLVGHEQAVKDVNFSPDGEQVFSVSMDGTLRVWSALTGQELDTIQSHPTASNLAVDPHGNYIATGGNDGAKLWSAKSGQLIHHWRDTTDIWWIDFSPDGKRIVVESGPLGGNNVLLLFDVSSRRQLLSRETSRKIEGLVFCTDSRRAVSVMYGTGQLDLWDLDSGEAQTFRMGFGFANTRCLVRSPRANMVAVIIGDTIELWDIEEKQLKTTLRGDGQTPYCLAFNDDGSRLFSGDCGGTVKVWNVDTDAPLLSFQAHEIVESSTESREAGVLALAVSPDGKTLATAGADGKVKLWETTFPSLEVSRERQIVAEATKIVNERYQQSGAQRAVLESLAQDDSIEQDVLDTAVKIVSARGDRPLAAAPNPAPIAP